MHTAITAFFDMIKEFFNMRAEDLSHKVENELVRDKKYLKKASNITENIIALVDKYSDTFKKSDLRKYEKLKTQFKKYN